AELRSVVGRHARAERKGGSKLSQIRSTALEDPGEFRIPFLEEGTRRNVMVDERLWPRVADGLGGERRSDGVVIQEAVARADGFRLEPGGQFAHRLIVVLNEDLGGETEVAQHFADERRLVRDGITVCQVGQQLVDRARLSLPAKDTAGGV